jgi:hypothetical protein
MAKNERLSAIVQALAADLREAGWDKEDIYWLAVGAVNREARKQGLVGDELPREFNAAAQALVKQEMQKEN